MEMPNFITATLNFIASYEFIWACLAGVFLGMTSSHPREIDLSHAPIFVVYPGLFLLFRAFEILPNNSASWAATVFSIVFGAFVYLGITFHRSKRQASRSFNRYESGEEPRVRRESYSDIEDEPGKSSPDQKLERAGVFDPEDHL